MRCRSTHGGRFGDDTLRRFVLRARRDAFPRPASQRLELLLRSRLRVELFLSFVSPFHSESRMASIVPLRSEHMDSVAGP